jgi:hypothetical protein
MNVRFTRFWRGFEPKESFFWRYLISQDLNPILASKNSDAVDLEFQSVFPSSSELLFRKMNNFIKPQSAATANISSNIKDSNLKLKPKLLVWYTGENIRSPILGENQLSLSFDQDSFNGSNIYFPLWYTHLNLMGGAEFNSRVGVSIEIENLLKFRALPKDFFSRDFACTFFRNPQVTRMRAVKSLGERGKVGVFGNYAGKHVKYKTEVSSKYKFMICFENDLFPGYVTEKLLDAYASGCIPLYWGDLGNDNFINRKCFINLKDFDSLEEFTNYIVDLKPFQLEAIYREPFLENVPTLEILEPLRKRIVQTAYQH